MSKLCREVIRQREKQNLQYNDMLNNLIELSKINPDMTEEMMIKTCVQFFSDGYESASQVQFLSLPSCYFGYLYHCIKDNT